MACYKNMVDVANLLKFPSKYSTPDSHPKKKKNLFNTHWPKKRRTTIQVSLIDTSNKSLIISNN